MTQQDKDLLLRDLCARLPYGVNVHVLGQHLGIQYDGFSKLASYSNLTGFFALEYNATYGCVSNIHLSYNVEFKPYLRPLSSLTQEERNKFCNIGGVISYRPDDGKQYIVAFVPEALDYLNSIHADYRGLIEKGLAIEVTEENNPYKSII